MRTLLIGLLVVAFAATSCRNGVALKNKATQADTLPDDSLAALSLVGDWVRPIMGQDTVRGFSLRADSTAAPINDNASTLRSWKVNTNCDTLFLVYENVKTGKFEDTAYRIRSIGEDSLSLVLDDAALNFVRKHN